MTYKLIKDMAVGDQLEQICLVSTLESKTTKAGKPFVKLTLRDKSGVLPVNIWQFSMSDMTDLKPGVFAVFNLKIEDFKGSKSASASPPMLVKPPEDLANFQNSDGLSDEEVESYYTILMKAKDEVGSVYIRTYLDVMFGDPAVKAAFIKAPASATNRGAYRGGLVEHVTKVLTNARNLIASNQIGHIKADIDVDIVVAGVLTHDIGKIYAYAIDGNGMAVVTRSGILLEHLPMSYGISVQAFIQAESILHKEIPEEIKDHINHCILAHHGQLAYGSPVTPKSLESHIVHMADMADSSTSNYAEPTKMNESSVDQNGFVEGNRFSSKQLFVGIKHVSS